MILETDVLSSDLKKVIEGKKFSSTDILSFFDDSSNQKLLGASFVDWKYFVDNPCPNRKLLDNMSIAKIKREDGFYQSIVKSAAKMAIKYYNMGKLKNIEVIAFVMCDMIKKNDVENQFADMGYEPKSLPPVVNVLGHKIRKRGKIISMSPRDYWYKQQVGNYAEMLLPYRKK